jgi:hypothetical protein
MYQCLYLMMGHDHNLHLCATVTNYYYDCFDENTKVRFDKYL